MQIISIPEEGDGETIYDSRWQFPELLGYKPEHPQYGFLRKLWEEAVGEDNRHLQEIRKEGNREPEY